ncbi:MAG TPA: OmpH family outer membrane protein [Candidatus Coatesbacteria bacterium]|nr:OmpH family outer membrane protein [Candidatus Coatesbacteria bacterium]
MKKLLPLALLLALLVSPLAAQDDEEPRPLIIAYVDLQRVQDEWILFQETLKTLEAETRQKELEVQPRLDEYQKQIIELQKKLDTPLADEKRAEIRAEIEQIFAQANQLREGAIRALQAREKQELDKLIEKIYAAIDQLGQKTDYDLILDMTALIYGKDAYDITDDIIEVLNIAAGAE